jgi:hypothetical protein
MRAVVIAALLVPAIAEARPFSDWQGAAWAHYELSGLHDVDDTQGERPADDLVLAGARVHATVGHSETIGYHVGFDFAFGSTLRGAGFAYDVALFPVGVGVRVGRTGVLALGTGVAFSGAVSTIDDAVAMPLEAIAELGGGRLRLVARARASWILGAPNRQSAAPSAPFADELDAMIGLRIGHHYEEHGFPTGNGYFIGAAYRELAGTRFAGLVIGYGLDMATERKPIDPARPRYIESHDGCEDCE